MLTQLTRDVLTGLAATRSVGRPFGYKIIGMKQSRLALGLGAALLVTAVGASAQNQNPAPQMSAPASGQIAHGEYLATSVAMCIQCHSPRDSKGEIIASQAFTGGAIPFRSPYRDSEWALRAPSLRGLPGFTDEQVIMLLTEGHTGNRPAPRKPMPPFRMSQDDARAIVAFLRSR